MIIVRNNYLNLIPEDFEKDRLEQILQEKCVFENPLYFKKTKHMRNPLFSNEPKYIKTFKKENSGRTTFKILKANKEVYEFVKQKFNITNEIDQRTVSPTDIQRTMEPRDDEQKKALNAIMLNYFGYGILEASPAMGKSYCSLYIASELKQKTLILVDMTLLIDQFIDSILKFTNVKENEIGLIRGQEKNYEDKKIVIATIQTLSKKENDPILKYLKNNIGFVICDEVHIMSCNMAQTVLNKLSPKYMLGLSGTPNRDDQMDFVIKQSVGPIIHRSDRNKMVEAGSMLTPILRPLFLQDDELFQKYNLDESIDFRDVVDIYYNSPKAINKISNLITYHYNNNDSQLVICKEVSLINEYYQVLLKKIFGKNIENEAEEERKFLIVQLNEELLKASDINALDVCLKKEKEKFDNKEISLEELEKKYKEKTEKRKQNKINEIYKKIQKYEKEPWYKMPCISKIPKINSIYIFTGTTGKKEREKILQDVDSGKIKILLVTTTFDKALSANKLNILYLTFSTRERANTIQRVGRISRSFPNKQNAIVYDLIYDHYMSFYQFLNNKGDCRMSAYPGFVKIHPSIKLFEEFLNSRFKQYEFNNEEWKKWESKYVIKL